MSRSPLRTRGTRPSVFSLSAIVLLCLLVMLGLVAIGCGGDDYATATTATTAGSSDTPETTAAATSGVGDEISKMGGTELGTAMVMTWDECLTKLTSLLEGMPDPASVQPQVAALKEEYIQKFVAYGRQHQTFDEEQLRLWRIELGINSPKSFAAYQEVANKYIADAAAPADFKSLLSSFAIITQYADFELLKQQAPEEVTRLGIE